MTSVPQRHLRLSAHTLDKGEELRAPIEHSWRDAGTEGPVKQPRRHHVKREVTCGQAPATKVRPAARRKKEARQIGSCKRCTNAPTCVHALARV